MAESINNATASGINLLEAGHIAITFPKGLIGFADLSHFFLSDYGDPQYKMLTSQEDPDIRFLLYQLPWDFYPSEDLVQGLETEHIYEIDEVLYVIVCCGKEKVSINLRAPLVTCKNRMWQVILPASYPMDYELEA